MGDVCCCPPTPRRLLCGLSLPHGVCFSLQVALLNPIENPDLKLAIVMLIVPFFVNVSAMLHFTPMCSLPSSVLFTVLSLTDKAPYSPQAPPHSRPGSGRIASSAGRSLLQAPHARGEVLGTLSCPPCQGTSHGGGPPMHSQQFLDQDFRNSPLSYP